MRTAVLLIALSWGYAHAQSPGEISFWESVRDSRNPAELQAYIDQYPNGAFVVLAKARLATLQKPVVSPPPAVPARPAPQAAVEPGVPHKLQVGDAWTYRLSYPRLRGEWGKAQRPPATIAITLGGMEGTSIVDQVSVDGGPPAPRTHAPGAELVPQGASVFSPYLIAQQNLPDRGRLGSVRIVEPACDRQYTCEAKARIAGKETVSVAAGRFLATKVIVDQEWRGAAMSSPAAARLTGGRTLTIWYAAEIGRAVKYSSRLTVGDITPMDGNFDLELVSYQLK